DLWRPSRQAQGALRRHLRHGDRDTFAMGCLPTYAQAGILAPALLVVVRLFQGLSVGGEFGGSTAYIVEFAPPERRGFFGSFQIVGVVGGFLLGSLTAAL